MSQRLMGVWSENIHIVIMKSSSCVVEERKKGLLALRYNTSERTLLSKPAVVLDCRPQSLRRVRYPFVTVLIQIFARTGL